MARPLGPVPEHGTRQRYQLRGDRCRCTDCKAANRVYVSDRRTHRRSRPRWSQPTLPEEYLPRDANGRTLAG